MLPALFLIPSAPHEIALEAMKTKFAVSPPIPYSLKKTLHKNPEMQYLRIVIFLHEPQKRAHKRKLIRGIGQIQIVNLDGRVTRNDTWKMFLHNTP